MKTKTIAHSCSARTWCGLCDHNERSGGVRNHPHAPRSQADEPVLAPVAAPRCSLLHPEPQKLPGGRDWFRCKGGLGSTVSDGRKGLVVACPVGGGDVWRLGVECGERCPGFTLAAEPQTVQKGHTITIGEAPSVTPASDRLICTVAVGEKGLAMLAATGPLMQRYAAKVGADFLAITGEALNPHYPLGDKFRLHHFTTLYDRLMFIDADALVHPDAPDLFGLVPDGVAIFDDRPFVPNVDYHLRAFEETARSQGVELPARCGEWVLNSGVVLWGRGDFRLWEPPTKPLPLGMHVAEQNWTQINLLRASYEWSLLGREWNYQWWSDRPMAELGAVKPWVLHMAGMGQPEMVPGGRLEPAAVRQIALKAAAWATGR